GPHRIMEGTRSVSIKRRSSLPGANRCSCPTISSSVRGRIRAASGSPTSVWDEGRVAIVFFSAGALSDPKRDDCSGMLFISLVDYLVPAGITLHIDTIDPLLGQDREKGIAK